MSDSTSPVKWIALVVVLLVAAIPLGFLLSEDDAVSDDGPPDVTATTSPNSTDGATPTAPTKPIKQAGDPDLAASIDEFLAKVPVTPFPRPEAVLQEAREHPERMGPIDYRMKLEKALRHEGGPAEGVHMLIGMRDDSAVMRFQTAMALSKNLDAESTALLLSKVRTADETVRPDLVFALRGSPDPEVNRAFVDLYATDANPAVRAQAAFAIGERGERIDPLSAERARQRAREDFHSEDPGSVKAATDVLGVPPLSPDDRSMLERTLISDPDSGRRLSALRALATARIPPGELAPLLQQVANDASASDQLRGMANQVLERLANPEPPREEEE